MKRLSPFTSHPSPRTPGHGALTTGYKGSPLTSRRASRLVFAYSILLVPFLFTSCGKTFDKVVQSYENGSPMLVYTYKGSEKEPLLVAEVVNLLRQPCVKLVAQALLVDLYGGILYGAVKIFLASLALVTAHIVDVGVEVGKRHRLAVSVNKHIGSIIFAFAAQSRYQFLYLGNLFLVAVFLQPQVEVEALVFGHLLIFFI